MEEHFIERKPVKAVILCGNDSDDEELSDSEEYQDAYNILYEKIDEQSSTMPTSQLLDTSCEKPPNWTEYGDNGNFYKQQSDISMLFDSRGSLLQWTKDQIEQIETNCNTKDKNEENNSKYWNLSPLQYFELYFDNDIIKLITEQTNLYSLQTCRNFSVNEQEIRSFIGTLLLAGFIKYPNYRYYWSEFTKYPPIADAMSRNKFDGIKQNLHFNDNREIKKDNVDNDHLFKIRPFIDKLRENFLKINCDEYNCIEKTVIPVRTPHSKYKSYKLGIKMFVRCNKNGYMNDFQIYTGKKSLTSELNIYDEIVLNLCEKIPLNENYKVIAGNCFSSYELVCTLKNKGILYTGCIKPERLYGCTFNDDAQIKSGGRGTYDYRLEKNENILAIKWYDSKIQYFISSYSGTKPIDIVKRWSIRDSRYIDVPQPAIVTEYYNNIGGIDINNTLRSLYSCNIGTKKMYLNVFYALLDICVVNAWLLYKNELEKSNCRDKKKEKELIEFRAEIAHCLIWAGRTITQNKKRSSTAAFSTATSSSERESPGPSASKKLNKHIMNIDDIRFDNVGHFPIHSGKRMRCKNCKSQNGSSRIKCVKCDVGLCINDKKNCFIEYHSMQ